MSAGAAAGDPARAQLVYRPALERLEAVGPSVADALRAWPLADRVEVVEIDPSISDTAVLVEATGLDLADMANCVVVAGRRGGQERVAACVLLATTRADVNGLVRSVLDVRKASFLPTDRAVGATGMEYGAITPVGLPGGWQVLVDSAVLHRGQVVIGAGVRSAKLRLPGALVADLPGVQVIDGLAR